MTAESSNDVFAKIRPVVQTQYMSPPKKKPVGHVCVEIVDKSIKGHERDADRSVASVVWERLTFLIVLLLLQSLSQVILEHFEGLIREHVIISMFLTMLVGAGGNAGNQSAVRTITGIVIGEFRDGDLRRVLKKELMIGLICALCLGPIALVRVHIYYLSEGDDITTAWGPTVMAICLSLFLIVLISVAVGAVLPFALRAVRLNIEHAAPAIQVIMDISGVFITCVVCSLLLSNAYPTSEDGSKNKTLPLQPPPKPSG